MNAAKDIVSTGKFTSLVENPSFGELNILFGKVRSGG
jgi:hypothetical protein